MFAVRAIFLVSLVLVISAAGIFAELPRPTNISFNYIFARRVGVIVKVPAAANVATVRAEFILLNGDVSQQQTFSPFSPTSGSALVGFSGLQPATTYTVRVYAVEGNTTGPPLNETVTTLGEAPSGTVRNLTAIDTSSRAVTLTWQPPEDRHINSVDGLTGYHVQLRTSESSQCTNEPLQTVNTTATTATFSLLKPYTSYCVVVFHSNQHGTVQDRHAGSYTFTTAEEAPSNSPTFTLVQPQFTQLTVAWREPTQSNGVLTQYIIQYRQQGSSSGWTSTTHSPLSNTKIFINSEFTPGAKYELRIAARNAIGRGPFSSPVQFTMRPPILDICVCRLDSGSAKFVWTEAPRSSALGADLEQLKFTLSSGEETLEHTANNATSGSVFTGLKDREYSLQVELVWSEGEQLFFSTDTKDLGNLQTEPNCFPSRPTNLSALAHFKSFSLSWSAPSTTNCPVLKHIITVESRDSELPYSMTFEGKSTSLTVDGLEEAVQYIVKVRAVNKFGNGTITEQSVRTKEAAPSGPAQSISLTVISSTAIEVAWESPEYQHINAKSGVIEYKVKLYESNYNYTKIVYKAVTVISTTTEFEGLEPGSTYCVKIFPVNSVGTANDNVVRSSAKRVTLPPIPPAPKKAGQTVGGTHAVIAWEKVESTDEENPVTEYIIDSDSMEEPLSVTLPTSLDVMYYNVTGMEADMKYTIKVAAKNALAIGWNATYTVDTANFTVVTVTEPRVGSCNSAGSAVTVVTPLMVVVMAVFSRILA